jgi:hypothetical protein
VSYKDFLGLTSQQRVDPLSIKDNREDGRQSRVSLLSSRRAAASCCFWFANTAQVEESVIGKETVSLRPELGMTAGGDEASGHGQRVWPAGAERDRLNMDVRGTLNLASEAASGVRERVLAVLSAVSAVSFSFSTR